MELKQMANPANREAEAQTKAERRRIPMSVPVQKLTVPEIPGYHLHWFRSEASRLQRAFDAGYEYVRRDEVMINAYSLGSDTALSGSTDMGSNVSIASGADKNGNPIRLILMKIKQEWWEEDLKKIEDNNAKIAEQLNSGAIGAETDSDRHFRYVGKSRTTIPDMFTPKSQRR